MVLAPFEYTSLVCGDVPKINTVLGAALILSAGRIISVSE